MKHTCEKEQGRVLYSADFSPKSTVCPKCQDVGIIERKAGLEFFYCDCEIGKAIEAKKRAIYGIPEEKNWEIQFEDSDGNSGTESDNRDIGSSDTSKPEKPKRRKTKKKAGKRAS